MKHPAMTGTITTVQRMSIHDGPGIRSTVFFKGCNLRCKWCHNPETWSRKAQLQHINGDCIHCGRCLERCERGALRIENGEIAIDREQCNVCGACIAGCPAKAMVRVGRTVTVEELLQELLRDTTFYETSTGGITLSGGEPLLQPDFALALLQACKQHGLHTAVESNLCIDASLLTRFLPVVDLWMCDLKVADAQQHRLWTGASNEQTLANLHTLNKAHARIIVRTPVVPGVNDTPEAIEAICQLLTPLHSVEQYELLGFHVLGFDKFPALGMENPLAGASPLSRERLAELCTVTERFGWRQPINQIPKIEQPEYGKV